MKTDSIILSTGVQVNRTRRNGKTIITTGKIVKTNYKLITFKVFGAIMYCLALTGSFALLFQVIAELLEYGVAQVLMLSPVLLFIVFLQYTTSRLMINYILNEK